MLKVDPYQLTLGADSGGTPAETRIRFVDDEDAHNPRWDIERRSNDNLAFYHHPTSTTAAWIDSNDIFHVQDLSIEGASSLDAGTLDGLDSSQFLRSDVDDTHNGTLNVTGTLSHNGNTVLTTADEGSLDAGTLEGWSASEVTPSVSDDGTEVLAAPTDIDAGQYLQVEDDGDGTVTLASNGGNAVGSAVTKSGDGSQTSFTLAHDLGTTPASVDVTPLTAEAAADYHIENVSSTSLDVVYSTAPTSGSDNLEWHVTAFGNDGSGLHTIQINDNGAQVTLADTVNYGSGLSVADDGNGDVTVEVTNAGVVVQDDGTEVHGEARTLDFGANVGVTDNGDGSVTIAGSDTYPSVSGNGSVVVSAPTDINAGDNLTASDDGDGTVTVHASGDASTLGGYSASQFLRGDAADSHTASLGLTEIGAASGNSFGVVDDMWMDEYVGIVNDTGSGWHAVYPRATGIQSLTNGGNAPTDYGIRLEADATIALVEPDTGTLSGWVNTNANSLTMEGGVRAGDAGGDPAGALDVRGTAEFNGNEAVGFRFENRTSDYSESEAEVGQAWIRTDVFS